MNQLNLVFAIFGGLTALAGKAALAAASIPGVDSHYREVEVANGATLRAIITSPAGDATPRHPLLFLQWVSCGSVEYREGSGSREILASLARDSGLALVRVERSAVSGGPACEDLDFDTELAHYHDAFGELLEDERIDAGKVYLYGSSLGANTAPLVAAELQRRGYDIAGVIAKGGGALTYYERMFNFDRIYLERRPDDVTPAEIHGQIQDRARFQYEYLVEGRHPDDVARDGDAMRAIRGDILGMSGSDQYGRPFAWHQQLAQKNFAAAWAEIDAPVLVIFNGFDQYETRHGHELIADVVNRARPGTATYVERPGIGHSDYRFETILDAYADEGGEPAWEGSVGIMLDWLRETGR